MTRTWLEPDPNQTLPSLADSGKHELVISPLLILRNGSDLIVDRNFYHTLSELGMMSGSIVVLPENPKSWGNNLNLIKLNQIQIPTFIRFIENPINLKSGSQSNFCYITTSLRRPVLRPVISPILISRNGSVFIIFADRIFFFGHLIAIIS